LIGVYVARRDEGERFVETVARIGLEPFKQGVYATRKDKHTLEAA
jgi:sulfite reductase (NADPH) hemoprotein beta-component